MIVLGLAIELSNRRVTYAIRGANAGSKRVRKNPWPIIQSKSAQRCDFPVWISNLSARPYLNSRWFKKKGNRWSQHNTEYGEEKSFQRVRRQCQVHRIKVDTVDLLETLTQRLDYNLKPIETTQAIDASFSVPQICCNASISLEVKM